MKVSDFTHEEVTEIIIQALETLDHKEIYSMAIPYVDVEAMKAAQPIDKESYAITFAVAGFAAGISFALENLEVSESEEKLQ